MYDFPSTLPVEIVSGTNKPPNTTAPALKTCMAGGLGKSIPLSLGENRQPLTCLKKKKEKNLSSARKSFSGSGVTFPLASMASFDVL